MTSFSAVISDGKRFFREVQTGKIESALVCAYLIFTYLRPQAIYSFLDVIPWTQLTVVAGLAYSLSKGKIFFGATHFAVLLFFLASLLSSANSHYPDESYKNISIILVWLAEIVFFTSLVTTRRLLHIAIVVFLLCTFKLALFGARTWIGRGFGFRDYGIVGPAGFFANSGELSLLMAIVALLSASYIFALRSQNKLYWILPLTSAMTVLAASSRGGQLALAAGVLYLLSKSDRKSRVRNLTFALLLAVLGYFALPDEQKARFSAMGKDSTSTSRLLYWEKGIEMANEHPLLGVGFGCFPIYFRDHYDHLLDPDTSVAGRSEVAHNSLIEIASTMGYLGLAIYVWMHINCLRLWRFTEKFSGSRLSEVDAHYYRWLSLGFRSSLIAYFVGAMFMSVALYPYIYFLLMFSFSAKASVIASAAQERSVRTA